MDIRDVIGSRADYAEMAEANAGILRAHMAAGFSRKEAVLIIGNMVKGLVESEAQISYLQSLNDEEPTGDVN